MAIRIREETEAIAAKFIPTLKQFWHTQPPDAKEWFFGNEKRQIPFALGYTVGLNLVQKYRKKHPAITWAQLRALPSEEFI